MNTTERLVVAVEKSLKRKFFDAVNKNGTTATFIIRKFLSDYTKKKETNGRRTSKITS